MYENPNKEPNINLIHFFFLCSVLLSSFYIWTLNNFWVTFVILSRVTEEEKNIFIHRIVGGKNIYISFFFLTVILVIVDVTVDAFTLQLFFLFSAMIFFFSCCCLSSMFSCYYCTFAKLVRSYFNNLFELRQYDNLRENLYSWCDARKKYTFSRRMCFKVVSRERNI